MTKNGSGSDDRWEEYRVKGEDLLGKVKELVHEGNIRRLIIENEQGKTLVEIPLTLGVVGALLLPMAADVAFDRRRGRDHGDHDRHLHPHGHEGLDQCICRAEFIV